jgi:recombination protein RecT
MGEGGLKERLPAPGQPGTAVERSQPQQLTPAQRIQRAIEAQAKAFEAVMPAGLDHQRFARLVLTAVKATPKLMECFGTDAGRTSVLLAAMDCAAVGLEPNTPTQDAWILPRWNSKTKTQEAELSISARGLVKLARRSGVVKSIRADVVRAGDEFHYEFGLDADVLRHVPYNGAEDPGELTHAYAVVRFTNGGSQFVVLTRRDVEKRRAMSTSWSNERARPYSPWTTWEDEMWRKSAIRALIPFLELRTEEATRVERDEQPLTLSREGVIEVAGELTDAAPGDDEDVEEAEIVQPEGGPDAQEPEGEASGNGRSAGAPSGEFVAATQAQMKALHALLKRKYGAVGDGRHGVVGMLLDRDIESLNEVSKDEASRLIDEMNEMPDAEAVPQ